MSEMSADSSTIAQDIICLRQWISKQPHLPQDHDDAWLEKFLRGCKNSIERCKELIDNYYTTRTLIPELFSDRDPTSDEIKSIAKIAHEVYLPNKTPEGYTVWIISNTEEYYKTKSNIRFGVKRLNMLFDAHLYLESSDEWIFIYDVKNQTPQASAYFTPSRMEKFNLALKNRPIRMKQVHIINAPSWFVNIVAIFKTFCSEKIKKRIFVHGEDYKELYNYVPKDILPHEYGGEAGSINDLNDECQMKLEKIRDWFIQEEEKKTDESKRPAEVKSKLLEDNFGMDGSFRKLNVD